MTSTKTQAQKERLAHHKVRHHLFAPFTKDEFARIIAYAVNDREKRLCPRYRVRGTAAVLHFGDREVPARVVNLSKCGVLVEQACSGRYSECLEDARIDLMFASEYGGGRVSGLMTTVRRVDVVTWQEDLGPELVRSARRFVHPSEEMKKAIQSVLDQVGQELLVYEDQIDEPF
jgi:hypothetical protein